MLDALEDLLLLTIVVLLFFWAYKARNKDMDAVAFNAQDVSKGYGFMTLIREKFARVKCVLDLYVFPAHAHFLGDKIAIPE
jgi:SanA protein